MIQFPSVGALVGGTGAQSAAPVGGRAGQALKALAAADPASDVLGGDWQALIVQLPPALIERLGEWMAGGMSLPQAASRVLAEAGMPPGGGGFDALLRQHGVGLAAGPEWVGGDPGRAGLDGALRPAPTVFATTLPGLGLRLEMPPALQAPAPLPATLNPAPAAAASPLTGSLLDMGVPQPVGGRGWDGAIAERVLWMVQGDQQSARLTLNPPNLGPLEVRVTVNQDQTSVTFLAGHAAVREALEAALPRLRELFDQQSLTLVRADVSDPGAGQGDRAGGREAGGLGAYPGGAGAEDDAVQTGAQGPVMLSTALVDLFV